MGLLFPFPVNEDEKDHAIVKDNRLTLKSYGLPYIFWFYLLSVIFILAILFFAIKQPILAILNSQDQINLIIAYLVIALFITLPLVLFSFYFYEKSIIKTKENITLIDKIFGLSLRKRNYLIEKEDKIEILHHLDSPNVATLADSSQMAGFKNKGYYQLFLFKKNGKKHFIDRHSQVFELKKLKALLDKY